MTNKSSKTLTVTWEDPRPLAEAGRGLSGLELANAFGVILLHHMTDKTLTVTWEDPRPLAEAGRGLSGLEFLQKMVRGELPRPPLAALMNFDLVEVSEGRATFAVEPAEYHYNPIGVVHGGLAATLLDSAMGCAVHSTLPAGAGYTTLEVKVNFIRAMTAETGRVRCEAKVVHVGSRTATAEGRIFDEAGKLYAHGTTTCMILRASQEKPQKAQGETR